MKKFGIWFFVPFGFLVLLGVWYGIKQIIRFEVRDESGRVSVSPSARLANIFALKNGYIGKIKKIVVSYTVEEQDRMRLVDAADNVMIQNINWKLEGGVLTMKIYYNPLKIETLLQESGWVNRDVWAIMCMAVEGPKRDGCYQKASDFDSWSRKWLGLATISQVYAACSGTVTCGVNVTTCGCYASNGRPMAGTCNVADLPCGYMGGGRCQCTTVCDESLYTALNCSSVSDQSTCNSITPYDDCAFGGDCNIDQSCTWTCTDTTCASGTTSCNTPCGSSTQTCSCTTVCGGTRSWTNSVSCRECQTEQTCGWTNWDCRADTCNECGSCTAPFCGQTLDCGGTCSNADNGNPTVPTCGVPTAQELRVMPTTINWTSGGALTDYYEYRINDGVAVNVGNNLSASGITVAAGANNFTARAVNSTCDIDASAWSSYCNFCYETGPTLSAWSPACGMQTRTCTENCTTAMSNTYTDDCAGQVLSQCGHCEPTVGAWSVCNPATHTRTRTCTDIDGACDGDDCASTVVTEDCIGTIQGNLFDASDLTACPADIGTNPIYDALAIGNQTFGITPSLAGFWPVITSPLTDADGHYSVTAYSPASYNFNFDDLYNSGRAENIKFSCDGSQAVLVSQGDVETMNFGFWRLYDGWWQARGGSVYAAGGVRSHIPASLTPDTNERLILPDINGRTGVLSYGSGTVDLGTNPNALVSDDLWRIQSVYEGLRYDYDFYDTRMSVFPSTAWDGGVINYNDGGNGYQILRHSGNVSLSYAGPTGTQRVILLVDGSVTVNSNVVVPDGAFLGVIASGNITFASGVANAQGWFVAEGINVPCNAACDGTDVAFAGEGSFVGWTGMALTRSLGGGNNNAPAESFTYRPDMVLNMPEPMGVYTKKFSAFIP